MDLSYYLYFLELFQPESEFLTDAAWMTSNGKRMISDEELLQASLHGDEAAFTALYRRRQGAVYRFALHMSGDAAVSEDVAQEVFMALLESGSRYDPARGTLLSFVYGIARNLLLRRLEKKRPEESDALADELAADDDVLADLTKRETIEAVRSAVLSLPAPYREAVVLCDLENASYEDAAATLEVRWGRCGPGSAVGGPCWDRNWR
jgi:RNA polymerase sigma-70 factor (ECF subfamily)